MCILEVLIVNPRGVHVNGESRHPVNRKANECENSCDGTEGSIEGKRTGSRWRYLGKVGR